MLKLTYNYKLRNGRQVHFTGTWPVDNEKNRLEFSKQVTIAKENNAVIMEYNV